MDQEELLEEMKQNEGNGQLDAFMDNEFFPSPEEELREEVQKDIDEVFASDV